MGRLDLSLSWIEFTVSRFARASGQSRRKENDRKGQSPWA
jgi:hypothetical protein